MSLNTNPDSPRQKMINLMYIVLMALLALNVSSDVLNGFSLVDESLSRTRPCKTNHYMMGLPVLINVIRRKWDLGSRERYM